MKRNLISECEKEAVDSLLLKQQREREVAEERRLLCNRAARIARRLGIPAKAEQRDTGRRDVVCLIEMNGHRDTLLIGVWHGGNNVGVLGPTTKTRGTGWVPVSKDLRTLPTVLKHELSRYAEETASINKLYKKSI